MTTEPNDKHKEEAQGMPPDISQNDSERLQGFMRMTAVEIKAVGGVGAATSLEMIGYIRELEQRLSSRDREIREVLEGLRTDVNCWCPEDLQDGGRVKFHGDTCLATRALYQKVQP